MRRIVLLLLLATTALAGERFTYIYARGSQSVMLTHGSLDEAMRLRNRFTGTYLWARLDGRQYLIRDAALLEEVRRAHAPIEALNPDQKALRTRMDPLERKQERLEDEYDRLSDQEDGPTAAERDRMRQLRGELRDIERELRQYEREEQRLDQREEELEVVFDAGVRRLVERAVRNGLAQRVD